MAKHSFEGAVHFLRTARDPGHVEVTVDLYMKNVSGEREIFQHKY
jgi:hypothetical protein